MGKRVFISYNHKQLDWVQDRLRPCLEAGGAEVLIDVDRFKAGRNVTGQMDQLQDSADCSLLVLTPDYLQSDYCQHEMKRSINRDTGFKEGRTIPVMRLTCTIPPKIARADPLRVDLVNDRSPAPWDLLLTACQADLRTDAPHWLEVRDDIRRSLESRQSLNLRVTGFPRWREMISLIAADIGPLGKVDLDAGSTATRHDLIKEILKSQGIERVVPRPPDDLPIMERAIQSKEKSYLALTHFDHVSDRNYGNDFFFALRHLMTESRKLTLLVQSRTPLSELLPEAVKQSEFGQMKMVELNGRKR